MISLGIWKTEVTANRSDTMTYAPMYYFLISFSLFDELLIRLCALVINVQLSNKLTQCIRRKVPSREFWKVKLLLLSRRHNLYIHVCKFIYLFKINGKWCISQMNMQIISECNVTRKPKRKRENHVRHIDNFNNLLCVYVKYSCRRMGTENSYSRM